ncbi:MAG: hypothetical protein HYS98_09035, partial [Deltaproteobacteria bacterium]|nr:hypothetical protein [Deltaproteobacteria bacterium]
MKVLKVALVCLFFLKLHFVLALEDSGELFFQKPKTSVSNVPLIKSVSPKNKLFYNAKKHNFDVEKKKIFMSGDVLLQYEGNQVKAQKADIDLNQKIMELSGNVDMNFEDGTSIQAQRVLYYYEKGEAKIFNGRVKSGADIFKAQVIQRNADSSFGVKKGYWTYCDHDFQKNPDWKVWCSSVIPVTSKYGLVYNPIFYVKKLPVFWLPVMLLPLNKQRQSGVLFPKFSFNELNGFTMLNQLYLALSPHQDATLGYTYFGNRGHKASLEYRFLPLEGLSGLLHGYYIDDEIFKIAEIIREKGTDRSSFMRGEKKKYSWV